MLYCWIFISVDRQINVAVEESAVEILGGLEQRTHELSLLLEGSHYSLFVFPLGPLLTFILASNVVIICEIFSQLGDLLSQQSGKPSKQNFLLSFTLELVFLELLEIPIFAINQRLIGLFL